MSRRCRPGQRARIICGGWNHGKIVVVVRHYFGEDVDGTWPLPIFPWVVSSLGALLRRRSLETVEEKQAKMMMVCDDCDLEPLDDDDEGLDESTDLHLPILRPKEANHG